jgi:glycosyltransferase involved in cell wall biosynthesis
MDHVLPVSVVVPVRNAGSMLEECLSSIERSNPAEVIVVDGLSTDDSLDIARRHGVRIISDEGRGVAAARMIGARAASSRWIALVDADVILPAGALCELWQEFIRGGYTGLQAGLASTSGPGYWGRALVQHHRTGRSKNWFGLVATIFERTTFLGFGLDHGFASGEDIELRTRLERAGERIGVSREVIVSHRFGDSFPFARGQWLADGAGLARTVRKHGLRSAWLLLLPLAAAARGSLLSLISRQPVWLPYYLGYLVYNYLGLLRGLLAFTRRS